MIRKIGLIIVSFFFLFSPLTIHLTFAEIFPTVIPGQTQQISILGSTVTIKGITDQDNKLFINQREVIIQKDGSFQEDIIVPLGETEITVEVTDKQERTKTYQKKIEAKQEHFFLVGIADGTINYAETSKDYDWKRDNSSIASGWHTDGKISYYLVGKVKGKYLIKSSLDTDKATQEKLFSNIDPQEYYPIYGDNSTVVYDVNSQGKFYLLVEWDKSGFTMGNYQTMIDDTQLAKYNRTLYGGKIHLETKGRTIYGDPQTKFTGFFAEINQYAGHNEFLATGGSLYYLRHRNIVEGSEQVRLDIRDKYTGMIIYTIPQKENIDYEIKYDEGRILFKQPILSVVLSDTLISGSILEGNPVYIVVNYEYKSQEAFPIDVEDLDKNTGGIRVSRALGDHIQLGGTCVQENTGGAKEHLIYGQDITIKVGNFTKIVAELAQSKAESIPGYISYNGGFDFIKLSQDEKIKAKARSFSLNSSLGEFLGLGREFMDISSYYQYIDRNFSSTDSLFEAGTEKYGVALTHKLTEDDKIRLLMERQRLLNDSTNQAVENQITARRATLYTGQWIHTANKLTLTTEYQHKLKRNNLSYYDRPLKERTLAERISYKLNDKTSFFVGQQVTLSGHSNNQSQAGITTELPDNTSLSAQTAFGNAGSSALLGLQKQVNENTSTYMTYSIVDSKIDGKTSTTSFGANSKINEKAELRTERQFITSDARGVYTSRLMGLDYQVTPRWDLGLTYQRREEQTDPNLIDKLPEDTVSINTSYIKPDKLKMDNNFEFRQDSDDTEQLLTNNSAELKLTQDIFLFGEYDYSLSRRPGNASYAKIDIKHIGLAFRPVEYDWFNCLFKYIHKVDERPEDLTSADGGFVKMNTTSDVLATEFALDLPGNFQFVEKYSYKDEKTTAYDILGITKTPENLKAHLFVHRINYHLTKQWDIAAEYRLLTQKGNFEKNREGGILFEILRKVFDNLYAGLGCNFTSFTDDLTEKHHKSARGFFFRLQGRY